MFNARLIPVNPAAKSHRGKKSSRKAKLYGRIFAGAVLLVLVFLEAHVSAATVTIDNGTSGGIPQALIDAGDGGTVILRPGTYFENSITLTNSTTIKADSSAGGSAENTIIDAGASGRIFYTGVNSLTLDNLTLENGNEASGGAIYSNWEVTATSCEFINCTASGVGGAIYSVSVSATSCSFTDCSANYGGAIDSTELTVAASCRFTGCTAVTSGGAVNSGFRGVTVSSSVFTGCSAGSDGGAIRSSGNVMVPGSSFTGCSATFGNGGAIYSESGVTITSSPFLNCSTGSGDGGAFCCRGDAVVETSTFTYCSATNGSGGAFCFDSTIVSYTITSCTFTGCSATLGSGGAINSGYGSLTVTSCNFTGCSTGSGDGGAINSDYGTLVITSSGFTDCSADSGSGYGGGVDSGHGTLTVTSSFFTGCTAVTSGGGIRSVGNITVSSSTFTGCSAGSGGGIRSNSNLIASSSTFTGCSADNDGGAIRSSGGVAVTTSTFNGCSAGSDGGAISFESSVTAASLHLSRIYNCSSGGRAVVNLSGDSFDATNNWWGTNEAPSPFISNIDFTPWIVLGGVSDPYSIKVTETSVIGANLTFNSNGDDISGSGHIPDGISVAFDLVNGSGSLSVSGGTIISGTNSSVFTPSYCGLMTVNVTVDDQSVSVPLTVIPCASFTASPLSGTIPLDVTFTDESTGSPAAWNWSFGDGEWFNTTDPALSNPVHTYSAAGMYTVSLTINPGGDTFTRTDYIVVTLTPTPTVSPTVSPTRPPGPATRSYSSAGGRESNVDTGTCFSNNLKTGNCTYFEIDKGAVCTVAITPGTEISEIMITVRKDNSLPSYIDAPGTLVYEYEDVTLYYANDSDLSGRTLCFRVKKSWLESKGYDMSDIVMLHYDEASGEWEELLTTYSEEDNSYYYYSAETPSFSWFAIAVSEDATIVPESILAEVTPAVTEAVTPVSTPVAAGQAAAPDQPAASPEERRSWYPLLIQILFFILMIIVIRGLISRWRRKKYPEWWDKEFK